MKNLYTALLLLFATLFPLGAFAETQPKTGTFTVVVKDSRISVKAVDAGFRDVLKEVADKSGVKLRIFDGVSDKKVTIEVKDIPIYAISELLDRMEIKNYGVGYARDKDQKTGTLFVYVVDTGTDIRDVMKDKTVIRRGNFAARTDADRVKGKEIVTDEKKGYAVRYVKDEVLLKFHRGVTKKEIDEILKKHNLIASKDNALSPIGYIKATIPDGRDVRDVAKEITKERQLKLPEPNYVQTVLTSPTSGSPSPLSTSSGQAQPSPVKGEGDLIKVSDPLYSDQWYVPDTSFDKAWEKAKSKTVVKVAVIDSGVQSDHPDLKGKLLKGYDFVNGDEDASDDNGHGTFVAGIIAAAANDSGIKGLYDYARIIPVKVMDSNGLGTYEDAARGIIYAADSGAKVINLSIGGYGFSYMLQDAVDYALEKGCIVVAAGGNDGIEREIYPAAYPDVIGVSALEYSNVIWPASNSGRHIDVSAPGANIISTGLNGEYNYATGTSASAPMVSALAAMLASERTDLSSSSIERLIMQSARDLGDKGRDKIFGSGEIDASTALEQQVRPFHDVAVRRVNIEPMVFEKGKPTYIVADIENVGTSSLEVCDVVLNEVVGDKKKEIGRKTGIVLVDKQKVVFEWKVEGTKREDTRFEVVVFSDTDEIASNNTKSTRLFTMKEESGLIHVLHKSEPWSQPHQYIAGEAANLWPGWNGKEYDVTVTLNNITISNDTDPLGSGEIYIKFYVNNQYVLLGNYTLSDGQSQQLNKSFTVPLKSIDDLIIAIIAADDDDLYEVADAHNDQEDELIGKIFLTYGESSWNKGTFAVRCYHPNYSNYYIDANITVSSSIIKTTDALSSQKEIWPYIGTKMKYDTYKIADPNDPTDWSNNKHDVVTYSGKLNSNNHKWGYDGTYKIPYYGTVPYSDFEVSVYSQDDIEVSTDCNENCNTAGSLANPGDNIIEGSMEEDVFNVDNAFEQFNDIFYNGTNFGGILDSDAVDFNGVAIFTNHFWDRTSHAGEDNKGLSISVDLWKSHKSAYAKAKYYWDNYVLPNYYAGKKDLAYYYLGRIAHLLVDMTVPAHALNDGHALRDKYENWAGENYFTKSYLDISKRKDGFPDSNGNLKKDNFYDSNGNLKYLDKTYVTSQIPGNKWQGTGPEDWDNKSKLFKLFWLTAEIADNWDSDDKEGEVYHVRNNLLVDEGVDDNRLSEIGDQLLPLAMSSTAELYKLFWGTTHPPTVNITAPQNSDTLSGTVSVTASATNESRVEFYIDDVRSLTDSASPYVYNWNTAAVSNGLHTIKAIAYNNVNQPSNSHIITVTVSAGNNAPTISTSLTQHKSGGTSMAAGATTNERTIIMKGGVTDPDNDFVSLDVEIKPVGTLFSGQHSTSYCPPVSYVASGSTVVVTCTGLADGQYKWQARAKDSKGGYSGWSQAGYSSESSADFIVSAATVVNTPPVVTMISPNGGETWTASSPYTIKWSAIDDTGTLSKVEIYNSTDGGVSWSSSPINSNTTNMGTYSWTPTSTTTQGRIKVVATDSGNAQGIAMSNGNFSVVSSCAKPSTPTLNSISPYGSSYTVSWSASNGATYNLQQDTSSSFTNPSVVYISNGISWYSGDKLSGTYYYRIKAINNCGESGWSNTQSVVIQANQGPGAIAAVSPGNDSINQPLNLTLSWNATHSGGESLKYNVYVVHSDTTIFYPNNIQSYEQTGTTFALSNLPYNTTISWGIEAIDSTGDRKYSPMFHFITVGDATVPTGSVIINNGAASTTSYSVTLNLSAADSNSGVRYMRLSNDGTNWTYWIPNSSQYAWNLADYYYGGQSGLSTYTVYAKFRDYEGNESQVYSDTITKTTGTAGQILLNGKVYQNIQDAIDAATSGETVYLTEGMYQFAGSVIPTNHTDRTGGIQMKPGVTLKGAGAGKTTIDVSGYAFAAIIDADNSVIEGLTIINSNSLSWRYVVLLESDSSKIKNCIIKGGASGVYVGWNATYSARNSEISNNTIINNSQSGIWLNSGSDISIFNNTIANNTQYGLFGFLASAKIINNIIANNGAGGYCGISSYEAFSTFQNNDVFSNYANYCGVSAQTGINGNISSNPSFANTSVSDYHLNSGSPAIDTGSNVGIAYNGGAPDMGAYEYNGTGTIQVTSNHTGASFTIKGPSGTYNGSGMSWSMAGLPIGIYNATFAPITSRYTPSYQTTMLYSGQTLTFEGTYAADTVGPTGAIAVNFEEYATADSFVSVTFDIIDDVAGVGESSQMMFSNDGVTWAPAEPYSAIKKDWDLTLYGGNTTSGTKTVYAKVSDLFGNWSTLSDTIKYVPDRQILEVPTQYSTIQSAIDVAQDGDMVYVLPGTYTEQITLNGGIRLQGSGAENTILDGNNTNINVNDNTIIDGFTITTNPSSGISSNASSIISNNTILGYAAIGNGNGNGRLIIRNNIIKVSAWGIHLGNNCSSCPPLSVDIENNIITGAARGIDLIGSQLFKATVNLRNNIFYNNGTAINDRHSDTTRKHFFPSFNTYWNNTNNFAGNISAMGAGDINSDPLFVDSANANYQLQTNSPAFNSGNPEGKYNDPDGSRNDRGASGGPSLNAPPKADFSISSLTAVPGTTFTFDAGLSHDGESKDEKLQVRWDFDGNGTYDTNFATDKIATRKYDTTATFNVALQVKDEKGYLSTATKAISVVSQSPNIPANSVPADTSTTGITPILSWSGGDPDYSDTVTYDVYFGTSSNPPLISSGQTETYFSPGTISYGSVYYWQVVATDNHGTVTTGPVWYFVTELPDITAPATTTSPAGGTYSSAQSVTLTCSDGKGSGCDKIYYTTDGSTPISLSTVYTTPIAISTTKTLKFFAKDLAGNNETVKTVTYTIDTTAPVFTSSSPASNSYINTSTVGYTLSEDVAAGKVTFTWTSGSADPSSPHVYNLAAPDMTVGTHSVNTGLSLVNGAIYTVTFEATDPVGNVATPISGTNVAFDTTTASVTINTPASGSIVNNPTVTYVLSEDISGGEVVFIGTGGNADSGSPHRYTLSGGELTSGSHTINTGHFLVSGAVYSVGFENVTDKAGNATAAATSINVTFDSTAVAITATAPAASSVTATTAAGYTLSEAAQSGKVTFTRTGGNADAASPHVYTLAGADLYVGSHTVITNLPLVDGAFYTVSFDATDYAGNPATSVSNAMVNYDDKHSLSVNITGSGSVASDITGINCGTDCNEVYNHGTTVILTATPDITSTFTGWSGGCTGTGTCALPVNSDTAVTATFGLKSYVVTATAGSVGSITPSGIISVTHGSTTAFTVIPNANYMITTVTGCSGTLSGNIYTTGAITAVCSVTATFASDDTTAPTTTAFPAGGTFNSTQSVTLTCSDGTGLGCDKIYYTTNGATPTTSSTIYSGPISISSTTTLKFFAKDLAGNSETVKTEVYTINSDTTPPTGTISINSGAASINSTTATLILSCTDAGCCAQMQFSNDNTTWSTAETYTTSKTWTLATGDGTKTVYAKFKDTAGNWSTAYSDTIILDTTVPTTPASLMGGSIQGSPLYIDSSNAVVTTLAGSAGLYGSTDGIGAAARFGRKPMHVTTDGTNLFVADYANHAIRKVVIATGAVTTIAGSAGQIGSSDGTGSAAMFNYPGGITTDGVSLFVADTNNHTIRQIDISTGTVTTIAGSAGLSGPSDGAGSAALFSSPRDLTTDGVNLFVADTANSLIRKVVITTGVVTTVSGSAGQIGSSNGTGSAAKFNYPGGITTDGTNLFVADGINNTIRKVVIATGAVTTIAGSAGLSGSSDGAGSAALFKDPEGITTDGTNLFVADSFNSTIRKVVISSGIVTTIAGSAGQTGSLDGTGPAARFAIPFGITTDGNSLFVVDIYDKTIRKIANAGIKVTNTAPAPNSIITNSTVSYAFSEQALSGKVTFTRTGGAADGSSPHVYNFVASDLAAGSHSINTYLALVDGTFYTVSFDATDMAGNPATTVSNVMVLFDNIHDITVTITGSGTVTPAGATGVSHGATRTFTATPNHGYHISSVTGCGGNLTGNTFTTGAITADCAVTASFAIDTFTVTPTAGSGGAITPSTPQTLNYGSTASFTVIPNTGYHISSLTGCGGTLLNNAYTTAAITADCSVAATFASDDTTPPVFSSTAPASSSYINTVTVGYTLSEAVSTGKITFTRTGGSADSASHIYNFTDSDKTVGSHSVNTGLSLINAGIYTVTFEAADLAGNAATVVSNTGVVYDNTSASVVLNSPSSNSRTNSVAVSYTLNEEIISGDIVFTRTGGTADGLSPRKRTLGASEKSSGSHTVSTGATLIDGAIYTVGFENVTDKAGNATASVSNSSITYDSTAVAITSTTPVANGIITKSTVGYTLSEASLSGKVTFTRSGGNADTGSPHVYTLSGSDLYPGSHTVNTNQSLVDGTFYTVTFEATDMAGNPATTVSNAMVYYDSSYGIGPTGNVDNTSYSLKRIDGYDLIKLSIAFGSKPGDANWNPVCDLDKNGTVEGSDLMVLGKHFGEVQ